MLRVPGYPHLNLTLQDMDEIGAGYFFELLEELTRVWPQESK